MSRADLAGRIDTAEHRMDSIEHRLDASFTALSTQIVQSTRETRDAVLATLRDEMQAMGGSLRSEISGLHDEMHALHGITVRRLEKLKTALAEGLDEPRRFLKILHEDTEPVCTAGRESASLVAMLRGDTVPTCSRTPLVRE